jgi:hypothetical protein
MNTLERINKIARALVLTIALVYVLLHIIQEVHDGWLTRWLDALGRVLSP